MALPDPIEAEVIQTDDDIIQRNQTLRRRFINELTDQGQKFPDDPKMQYVFLTAMADMDRTALQNKKIGATERQGAADRQVALMIASLGRHYGANSPFEGAEGQPPVALPQLDSSRTPEVTLVPGETEIGVATENYDEFMARMDEQAGRTPAKKKKA